MTRDDIAALLSRCEAAMLRRDAETLAELHTEDCEMETPTAGGSIVGRDAVHKVYVTWFTAFPDLSIAPHPPVIDGHRTAQLFGVTGTDTGGFLGLPPSGKPFHLWLVLMFEIENGRIARSRTIYDFSGMLIQLGVLKVKAS
jgi:steroid delta-isomerase-like uncharacterized protein